jgi:hypothetical protein
MTGFMLKFVSTICVLAALAGLPVRAATTTINPIISYQTIEGLGGATCFYAGWITAHPYKMEIYTNAFAGLNLSMLRLGDWYRYQTPLAGFDSAATEIVANANRVLGRPVPVYISSWSPLVIQWPLACVGYTRQSRTNVASPDPQIMSNRWQLMLPTSINASSVFYRLIK